MTDGAVANARGPRRRRGRNKQRMGIKSRAVGRLIFWVMLVLSAVVLAYTIYSLRKGAMVAGWLMVGQTPEEVIYLRGEPERRTEGGKTWHYAEPGGARGVVRFGPDGRTRTISCMQDDTAAIGCSKVLGLGMGDSEDWLLNRLGPPTSERYVNGGKLLAYADLGVVYTMREFRVTGVTKYRQSSDFGYWPRALWTTLP